MKEHEVLKTLMESKPLLLSELSNTFGLYALWDHELNIRYIGCTPKATEGFRVRVTNKHVTGSEGRSHKFSQAYCTGRMWRYSKKLHPEASLGEQCSEDAKLAKKLRTSFIRTHCRVTFIEIPKSSVPENYFGYLTTLESRVQSIAPASMRAWEGVKFPSVQEPTELVDSLLVGMPELKAAAERQGRLYSKYVMVRS